jgi:hypothetical protein
MLGLRAGFASQTCRSQAETFFATSGLGKITLTDCPPSTSVSLQYSFCMESSGLMWGPPLP